jgi:outer membrane protein insertion porin family
MLHLRILSAASWRLLLFIALAGPAVVLDNLVSSRVAFAQGARVGEIRVAGNRRVEPETVRSYLQFSVGDQYDAGKVDRSLKALFSTGLFSDVRIDREGNAVVVTVVENPVIAQVAFEGNSEVDTQTLQNEVQLKPRAVFTRAKAQADVQRILDVYRRQGRFAASVEPKLIEIEQNRVNLVFEITEGNATKVKGVNFIGNRAFSNQQLRDIISTTQAGWFDFLKGTSVYDPDRLSLDRELLRQYYMKNGYADVRITTANAELDRDGSGFYITFAIDEGVPYNFGPVTLESSLAGVDTGKVRGDVLTVQGEVYNGAYIDKTVEKLTLAVAEQGYAFVRVKPKAVPDAASRTIGIVYTIEEGPRIYIERINVVGNTRTKDFVVRREFRLAEGDAYNPLLVDRAKQRLQGLGIFKSVEIKRRPGSASDRVVLDCEVVEQSTGELSFGAGYSTSEGVIGDISLTERNLLGNGQFLRLKLAGSFTRLQADLSFTEPRFLDTNIAAGFDIFAKALDETNTSGFKSTKYGGSLRMSYPLAENLWMTNYYTISRDQISSVIPEASLVIKEACGYNGTTGECDRGVTWTSLLGTTVAWDTRNHPRNPTRGLYFQVGADFAGVGGDVDYIRLSGEGRGYYPISEKITLVGRVIAGGVEGWGGQDIRLQDLYFKGGETVRGFNRSGYGPRDASTTDALGGKYFWAATAEVRFPLPLIPDDLGISAALFADAGSLWGASDFAKTANGNAALAAQYRSSVVNLVGDDGSVRSSAGGSILWNSPVGPLRVDLAKTITKDANDKEQFFRFGAQTKF